jgi:hypothetical protein
LGFGNVNAFDLVSYHINAFVLYDSRQPLSPAQGSTRNGSVCLFLENVMSSALLSMFIVNCQAIQNCMKQHGITSVSSEYTGSDDSGDDFDVSIFSGEDQLYDKEMPVVTVETNNYESVNGEWIRVRKFVEISLDDAVENACDDAIKITGNDGYENNEGGYGEFVINSNQASLNHCDRFTKESPESREFENGDLGPIQEKLVGVLKKYGIEFVTIDYSGYGDSGDSIDVLVSNGEIPTDVIGYMHKSSHYVKGSGFVGSDAYKVEKFSDAVDSLLWMVIEKAGFSGFWNGDGGGGDMTLFATGMINLDHRDDYVDESCKPYSWDLLAEEVVKVAA